MPLAALFPHRALHAGPTGEAALEVVYPNIEVRPAEDYGYQVLRLALARSGVAHRLRITSERMNLKRAQAELEAGRVSVLDFGTSVEFEERFRAVYFPVDRGLSGYRLMLIHRSRIEAFAAIGKLTELRRMVAGQGPGWSDTAVLRANGLSVETAEFDQLFRMLNAQRFDFFPLGAEEAHGLLARAAALAPDCVVEGSLALHYPFARLFFVTRGNARLHDALLLGLQRAHGDGSLQRLLEGNPIYAQGLERSRLAQRKLIELDNPALSARFRQMPSAYFYRP